MDSRTSAALAVFQATAARDPAAMIQAGQNYLEQSLQLTPGTQAMNEYAYTAAVLGAMKLSDEETLKALNEAYFGRVRLSRIGFFHHRLLNAYLIQNQAQVTTTDQTSNHG